MGLYLQAWLNQNLSLGMCLFLCLGFFLYMSIICKQTLSRGISKCGHSKPRLASCQFCSSSEGMSFFFSYLNKQTLRNLRFTLGNPFGSYIHLWSHQFEFDCPGQVTHVPLGQ